MRILLLPVIVLLASCISPAAPVCNASSDSRCVGEIVGSECTKNRSHTCIKTSGGAISPECDCLDSQGGPVPDDYPIVVPIEVELF